MHPAIAAGVAANMDEVAKLEEAARRVGASLDDVVTALSRSSALLLDNLGFAIAGPVIPQPDPDASILARLREMYGPSERATDAARRTAVAMTRRRDGWTPEVARAEFQARALAAVNGAAA